MKDKEDKKYIGRFKRNRKIQPFGFIHHTTLGTIFLHDNNTIPNNDIVVFKKIKESNKYSGKSVEKDNVYSIEKESNINLLLEEIINLISSMSTEMEQFDSHLFDSLVSRYKQIQLGNANTKDAYNSFKLGINDIPFRIKFGLAINKVEILKRILEVGRKLFRSHYEDLLKYAELVVSTKELEELANDGYFNSNEIDFIAHLIFYKNKNDYLNLFLGLSDEDRKETIFKTVLELDNLNSTEKENKVKEILDFCNSYLPDKKEEILTSIVNRCPPYIKLSLWLNNLYEEINFNEAKLFVVTLNPDDQILFLKKIFYFIKIGKLNLTFDDLFSLNIFDYEEAKKIEKEYAVKIDYSTSVALKVIAELNKNVNVDPYKIENTIYETVLKIVKDPSDIPELKGYFDKCEGRCGVNYTAHENENGEKVISNISYHRNEKAIPDFHLYCDGRKAIDKQTGKPSLSKSEKIEFWWCGNQPCFKPSRALHGDDWQKYSIQDFLDILKIRFIEKDYEILLGIINKANTFFKHLKCASCAQLLYPESETNYAYHRINRFACINKECAEKGKVVYLNHCLNGKCSNIIDSRKSSKCRPDGFDSEKCGWYVCDYCLSCCSSEQIGKSITRRTSINLNYIYNCHREGHRELGKICCYNCGHEMRGNKIRSEEYTKTLNWFIANRDTHKHIGRSGKNPKWWFVFMKADMQSHEYYERIEKLKNMGFRIPYSDIEKDYQLVAEGQSLELICSNDACGTFINLNENPQRLSAIKFFHNIFLGTKFETFDDLP